MKKVIIFTFLILFFLVPNLYSWQRNVVISPLRIVMDDKNKSSSVKIVNPGDSKTSYRISLTSMDADDLGRVKETDEKNIALNIIKFSPKRVTLPPKGIQTIRLIARPNSSLPAGEYRAHLKISPLPPTQKEVTKKNTDSLKINLNLLINTTIPIIFRNKDTFCSIKILDTKLKDGKVFVTMDRQGNRSALFNINILDVNNNIIASRNRVGFYTPNQKLTMQVKTDEKVKKGDRILIQIQDVESRKRFIYDIVSTNI